MNSMKSGNQVPFGMLLPILSPQLDKERGMQLNTLYMKLKVGLRYGLVTYYYCPSFQHVIYVLTLLNVECTHANGEVLCYFQKNEISKSGFVRHMRDIVGDHMLKMAVCKVQAQVSMTWLFKALFSCSYNIRCVVHLLGNIVEKKNTCLFSISFIFY